MLHITIYTNNQSDEFLDLILNLVSQGYKVTVKPPLSVLPQPISHEEVDLIKHLH